MNARTAGRKGLTQRTRSEVDLKSPPVFDNVAMATRICHEVFCGEAAHPRCDTVRRAPQCEGIWYSAPSPDLPSRSPRSVKYGSSVLNKCARNVRVGKDLVIERINK